MITTVVLPVMRRIGSDSVGSMRGLRRLAAQATCEMTVTRFWRQRWKDLRTEGGVCQILMRLCLRNLRHPWTMTEESRIIRITIVHHKAKAREECGDKVCTHRLYSASGCFNGSVQRCDAESGRPRSWNG